jgi:hypothetical protein
MGRLSLAWKVLTNGSLAARIAALLEAPKAVESTKQADPPARPAPGAPKPARSDAVTLLATLQREARLIDFLKEPIDGYSDAQVGAAVRDIHRQAAAVLDRQFQLRPVLDQAEGSQVSIAAGTSPGKIKRTGGSEANVGKVVHHGWQVTRCDVPVWTGDADTASIVAPAEVDVG